MCDGTELPWKFATVEARSKDGYFFGQAFVGNTDKDLWRKLADCFEGTVCEEQFAKATIDELKRGYSFVSDEPRYGNPRNHIRIFDDFNKFIGHLSFIGFEEEFLFHAMNSVDDANSVLAFVDAINRRYDEMMVLY